MLQQNLVWSVHAGDQMITVCVGITIVCSSRSLVCAKQPQSRPHSLYTPSDADVPLASWRCFSDMFDAERFAPKLGCRACSFRPAVDF